MTNEEKTVELLQEFVDKVDCKPETKELAYMLINDKKYVIAMLSLISYLCMFHPTLLLDLQLFVIKNSLLIQNDNKVE
jgi:hypothetical protein